MYHVDEMLLPSKDEGIYNWHYGMLVNLLIQEKASLFKTFIKKSVIDIVCSTKEGNIEHVNWNRKGIKQVFHQKTNKFKCFGKLMLQNSFDYIPFVI